MKVTLERLPESRVQLDIEVDQERLEQSIETAYKRLAAKSRIPGFRPGKAPRALVERYLGGRPGLIREALDRLVPDVYNEAIAAEDVEAIAQPELEIVELEPVHFKATVPVRPTVDLGGYQSIRLEPETVEVTEEMLEEQLQLLRRRHATQVPVDRGAQWDDIITGDVTGEVEGQMFLDDKDAEFPLRENEVLLVAGLAEAFLGMKKGDEKTLQIALPEDFRVERYQGKAASFVVHVKEVKEEQLPELDDEFANTINPEEIADLETLKGRIRDDMQKALQDQAASRFRTQAVDRLVAGSTIEYPRILVDREIDNLVRESVGQDPQAYAAYLLRVGRSEEEYRESLRETAAFRVRRALALGELTDKEHIEVTDDDVSAELDTLTAPMGDDAARFRDLFATNEGIETIRRNLLSRKTLDRLAGIASGPPEEVQPEGAQPQEEQPA